MINTTHSKAIFQKLRRNKDFLKSVHEKQKTKHGRLAGWGCSSTAEHWPGVWKALDSSPIILKQNVTKQKAGLSLTCTLNRWGSHASPSRYLNGHGPWLLSLTLSTHPMYTWKWGRQSMEHGQGHEESRTSHTLCACCKQMKYILKSSAKLYGIQQCSEI